MLKQVAFYSSRLHILGVCLLVVLSLPALSLLPPVSMRAPAPAAPKEQTRRTVYVDDGPNVVSAGLSAGTAELKQSVDAAGDKTAYAIYVAALATYNGLRHVGNITATSAKVIGKGIGTAFTSVAHATIDGVLFVFRGVGSAVGLITRVPVVSAYVRPVDDMPAPTIDPAAAVLAAADEVEQAEQPKPQQDDHKHDTSHEHTEAYWPLRGEVTTLFGVPHWPFQPTHTGLDISSGQPSGVTPIKPFRSGIVIETVYSAYGLGNYVVVDHGGGLTSVYAHLAAISVRAGQEVDTQSVLGYEGSTGASTGTHLHFEVRQDGQSVNPMRYIEQ